MDELDALERLVRRYSPSGAEADAVREFLRLATTLGYAVRTDAAGNGIAYRGRGRPRILFLGHIDTVEGRLPVQRRKDRLRGRGCVDAKAALIAALFAGREHPGPGEYRVIAGVGEETDSRGARHLVRGSPPDALLVGEPTGWDGVAIGYKGNLRLEATFRGLRTHFSSPFPTAADRAVGWVRELNALVAADPGPSPFRSMSAKTLDVQSRRTGGAEVARVTVDLRLPPGLSTSAILHRLAGSGGHARLRVVHAIEPIELPRTNPVVLALIAGIRQQGGRPTLWRKGGTSDLNVVGPAWPVGAAVYGPGDSRLDHTDRESISARELHRSVAVLQHALPRLFALLARPASFPAYDTARSAGARSEVPATP